MIRYHEIRGSTGTALLSNAIGGAWTLLGPRQKLLWQKFGGCLLLLGCMGASACLLARHAPSKFVWPITILCATILITLNRYDLAVHYYTVPALFLTLSIVVLLWPRSGRAGDGQTFGQMFLSAFLMGLAIMSRLPLLCAFPLGICGILLGNSNLALAAKAKLSGIYTAGCLAALLICLALLAGSGLLKPFFADLAFAFGKHPENDLAQYNIYKLLPMYIERGFKATVIASCCVAGLYFCLRLYRRHPTAGLLAAVLVTGLTVVGKSNGPEPASFRLTEVLLAISAAGALSAGLRRDKAPGLAAISIVGTAAAASMAFGSTLGLQTSTYGMWLALPAACLSLSIPRQKERDSVAALGRERILGASLVTAGLLSILLPGQLNWSGSWTILSDLPQLRPFRAVALQGVFAPAQEVESVDTLLEALQPRTRPGEPALFFNHIGGLYWLTDTRTYLESPVQYHSRPGPVHAQLDRLTKAGRYPALVVLNRNYSVSVTRSELREIEEQILERNHYVQFYSSPKFQAYSISDLGNQQTAKIQN